MKTLEKLSFPKLENEYLENILRQLVNQYSIIEIFFTRHSLPLLSNLIVHIENSTDAKKVQQSKWVKKIKEHFQIDVSFIFSSKLRHHYSIGNPFIAFYCHPSAVIFQNKELLDATFKPVKWKKYKKRLNLFENNFYHDHDLHKWQIKNLISEGSSNCVFTSYCRLIEYNLQCLEELYLGNKSSSTVVDERINKLIKYIPAVQKYFVKTSKGGYYLTDLFKQAKEASIDEESLYRNEMFQAVEKAEESVYGLIGERLNELRKLIKNEYAEYQEILPQTVYKDKVLDIAVQTILEAVEAEQIYLYNQVTNYSRTTYYLLLITEGASNEKLKSIINCIKNRTEGNSTFVLISHSRYWIQNNLYESQSFFEKIITENNLIYSSNKYHPDFHWESPHRPYHGDLHFFYKSVEQSAIQFSVIASNNNGNYCGLTSVFSLFFMSFCRTYIFTKTYYMPNYLSSNTLWELCVYADTDMRKHNYFIEQFWTNFFPFLDRNRAIFNCSSRLNTEEINQMIVIVEKLTNELRIAVIESGLLKDFKQN